MVCCVDNSCSSLPPSPLHTEIMNTLQHVNGSASERVSKRVCERERESERERERERERENLSLQSHHALCQIKCMCILIDVAVYSHSPILFV